MAVTKSSVYPKCICIFISQQLVVGESIFDVHCYPTHSYDTEAYVEVYDTSVPNPKYTVQPLKGR
jgi:hypothetical protein